MAESKRIDLTNYYNPLVGKITLHPKTALNHYLWNSPTEPNWDDIRNNLDGNKWRTGENASRKVIQLDASEHMTVGPGRFVSAVDFQYFRDFFNHKDLAPGTYTVNGRNGSNNLDNILGGENAADGLSVNFYQYTHPLGTDFVERAFVFGSETYEVTADNANKDLLFIVHDDGSKEIRGLKITPIERPDVDENGNIQGDDNFDFESSTLGIQQVNNGLKVELDPLKTGITVPIEYTGDVDALTITGSDFYQLEDKKAAYTLARLAVGDKGYLSSASALKPILMSSEFYTKVFNELVWREAKEKAEDIREILEKIRESVNGPIVIDLDGDGVETISSNEGISFDHDKNGSKEQTGWAGKDDGQLAMDLNRNGNIDDGGELFGNNTLLADGKTKAAGGFEALAQYDSNDNGLIDEGDEHWNDLLVWQDVNSDGVAGEGELKSLGETGIVSINLDYDETGKQDENGNLHKQSSLANWRDGNTTDTVDVWFRAENFANAPVNKFTHTEEIDHLPEVISVGDIYNLRDAMTQDETLLAQVKAYISDPTQEKLEDLVYQWTGTVGVEPKGEHKHVDMRKLAVLEKLVGESLDIKLSKDTGKKVEEVFDQFADYVAGNIKIQGLYDKQIGGQMLTADADGNISADWLSVNLHMDKLLMEKDIEKASEMAEAIADALTYNDQLSEYMIGAAQGFTAAISHYGEVADLKKLAELNGTVGDDGNNHLKAGSEHNILLEGAVLFGDEGNDKLKGGKDNDVLVGGAGNDKLEGKGGSDLYVFEKDFGKDKIDSDDDDDGSDVIRFAEYLQSDLNFVRSSDNLVITTKEGDNALKVEDFFEDGKDGASIDSIVFADYSFLDKNAIKDLACQFHSKTEPQLWSKIEPPYERCFIR
ncbi:hypothetical protein [Neisseria wadsworthii]|nr:hypothetical protein [Neisseria wadsworthii]QMT36108.1 hypothetical protein H3L96_02355 [Neisseria wadsworthii]